MMFSPAGNCCGVAGTIRVNGCAAAGVDGATVTIKSGATVVVSGTTSGGGLLAISIAAGTYTIEVAGPSGSGFASSSGTLNYSGGNTTLQLVANTATHICVCNCNFPVPKVLSTSDAFGTHALTWSSGTTWFSPVFNTGIFDTYKDDPTFATPCLFDGGECQMRYLLDCAGSCGWTLTAAWGARLCCPDGAADYGVYRSGFLFGGSCSANASSISNNPFALTFSMPAISIPMSTNTPLGCHGTTANPGGGGSMSVTP